MRGLFGENRDTVPKSHNCLVRYVVTRFHPGGVGHYLYFEQRDDKNVNRGIYNFQEASGSYRERRKPRTSLLPGY